MNRPCLPLYLDGLNDSLSLRLKIFECCRISDVIYGPETFLYSLVNSLQWAILPLSMENLLNEWKQKQFMKFVDFHLKKYGLTLKFIHIPAAIINSNENIDEIIMGSPRYRSKNNKWKRFKDKKYKNKNKKNKRIRNNKMNSADSAIIDGIASELTSFSGFDDSESSNGLQSNTVLQYMLCLEDETNELYVVFKGTKLLNDFYHDAFFSDLQVEHFHFLFLSRLVSSLILFLSLVVCLVLSLLMFCCKKS